jgi:hypothetical protein
MPESQSHTPLTYEQFVDAARDFLTGFELTEVLEAAIRKECSWHPNGFVVFHLDQVSLGRLRLHIWPTSGRRMRMDAPSIHSHVWRLCSRILAGVYTETLYREALAEDSNARMYNAASITYNEDANQLTETGRRYLVESHTVTCGEEDFHSMPAGAFHETLIPPDRFVATLMVTSSQQLQQAVVLNGSEISRGNYTRPALSQAEQLTLLRELRVRSEVAQ